MPIYRRSDAWGPSRVSPPEDISTEAIRALRNNGESSYHPDGYLIDHRDEVHFTIEQEILKYFWDNGIVEPDSLKLTDYGMQLRNQLTS